MGGQYLTHFNLFINVFHVYIDIYISICHIIEMLFTKPQLGG